MNDNLISVCLITYNQKKYIHKAIESVLNQKNNFKWDFFIADDFSTDGTREILIDYRERYPEIIKLILQEKNVGPKQNWIDLLSAPRSKYVAYFESDDYWTDPYKLQKQIDLMEKFPEASMCVALSGMFFDNTGEYITGEKKYTERFRLIYFNDLKDYYHTSTYLIRGSALSTILNNYQNLMIGDTAFRLLLVEEGPFVLLNEEVSVYRQTGKGTWTSLNNFEKDFTHYILYNTFRKNYKPDRRQSYAKNELKYLHKVLWSKSSKDNFKTKINHFVNYIYLIIRYDFLFFCKLIYYKVFFSNS